MLFRSTKTLGDPGYAQQTGKEISLQVERLKFMYENMFYIDSNGTKRLKPDTTMDQLNAIKGALIKINAIYNERANEVEELNEKREMINKASAETGRKIKGFCSEFNIEVPSLLKKLYGL